MRIFGVFVASFAAACTSLNPAFLTDSGGSSSDGSTVSTLATGSTGGVTIASDGTTTADVTTGVPDTSGSVTSEPATSEPGTGTSATTGPNSTTGAMECMFAEGADLELTYTTNLMPGCNVVTPRQAHVEVLGQLSPNQWKFNVCGSELLCRDTEKPCDNGEHIVFTFDGPAELVPTFVPGACHQIHLLARANDPDDPASCRLRLLRFADTRFSPDATHYVGATFVPGTDGLPGMVDWAGLLGFELVSKLGTQCPDDLNCKPEVGAYTFEVQWGMPAVAHSVGEGESFDAKIVTSDMDNQDVEIPGTFTALRARIEPGPCGTGQDFKWVWLAQPPP